MKLCRPVSAFTLFPIFFVFLSPFLPSAADDGSDDNSVPYYTTTTTDVAINCGYLGNSTAHDGRQWFGDAEDSTRSSGESKSSTADYRYLSVDPIPYSTARVSTTQFYYTFQVNPGQKFIRLHFYPSSYGFFGKSRDFFTVEVGPFTLLRNFSASVTANALGVKYLVMEYCVNVGEGEYLNLTFYPSYHSSKEGNFYAFVNGIEIVSMPTGLYFTRDGDLGVPIVGQNTSYIVDNSSALQMVQRLNIGGGYISPVEDFGMFRRWIGDAEYFLGSSFHLRPVNHFVDGIRYGNLPVFVVPLKIFYTSWRTTHSRYGRRANELYKFTWKIPVDLGFGYLVRLHFCDLGVQGRDGGIGEFNVFMNNLIAESNANVTRFCGGTGIPIYRDYVVMVKGDKREHKFDLLITLQSSDELVAGLLHGLEIFKLSSLDNNLASPNPISLKQDSTTWNLNKQSLVFVLGKIKEIVTSVTILIIVLNVIVFYLRQIREDTYSESIDNQSASSEKSFHKFSFGEMKSATQNFSEAFLVGRGGFGDVYKGYICGGSKIVAVKRLKSNSKQGAQEFWAEIETLSKIRHIHLLPLIGYCNDYGEMILVYDYIARGTLADNIYKFRTNGKDSSTPLTWEQRLKICIATARGLDYLHTGIECGIIHRDVKDTNILLDENLVAKISDFGLSKLEKITESQYYVSTKVKGTYGYLDPDYLISQRLTRKSDIYSFGVVLLVVLCGKPAVDRSIPGETKVLVSSFRECSEKGRAEDIIDPCLKGTISSESFSEFMTCIESCLQFHPEKRSTMAQIVARLERSLERQRSIPEGAAPPVDQFSEDESIQPAQIDQDVIPPMDEESVTLTSPVDEEIIGEEEIHTAELITREVSKSGELVNTGKVSDSGEKEDTSVKKPFWVRSFEAIKISGKAMKTRKLFSAAIPKTQGSEGEILKSRNTKKFFTFGEQKLFTRHLKPGSSSSGQKPSRGWPWEAFRNRGKHAIKTYSLSSVFEPVKGYRGRRLYKTPPSEGTNFQNFNLKVFTYAELKVATRNFRGDSRIGEGGFGSVYKGWMDEKSLKPSKFGFGMEVAVKSLSMKSHQGHKEWLSEINFLGRIRHPNLVQLIGYCCEDENRLLVYEYLSRGSLENYIFRSRSDSISMDLRIKISLGAAKGLEFLHGGCEIKIIHRDFKASNILLDTNYNAKLSDFGLAKDGPSGDSTHVSTRIMGTYGYAAPEYVATGHLTEKVDVFAFGVVLLEILAGKRVLDMNRSSNEQNLVEWAKPLISSKRKILQVVDRRLEGQCSLDQAWKLGNLALRCLNMDPKLRPRMHEVVTILEQLQDTTKTY